MSEKASSPPSLPRGLIGRRGVPPGRSNRLPSIRTPRDLTLGGVQKKTFVPNIPTRRKKEEAAVEEKKAKPSKGHEKRGRGGRERGRGRGRGRPEVIQSHSIFEQGPAERVNKPSQYDSERGGGGGGGGGGGRGGGKGGGGGGYPSFKREGDQDTKKILDYILRDDFTVDEDLGGEDPLMTPVKLPVSVKREMKPEVKPEVKPETSTVTVKQELDVDDESSRGSDIKMDVDAPPPAPTPGVRFTPGGAGAAMTVSQFFTDKQHSESGELIYIQLPDVLPGDPPLQDDRSKDRGKSGAGGAGRGAGGAKTGGPVDPLAPTEEEKAEEERMAAQLAQCSLVEFTEGFMGKLQIHQSGRATLKLGHVDLDVTMGTPTGFLEDLVSVRTHTPPASGVGAGAGETPGGDMAFLGHVHHKLVCSPDFESLIETR